MPYSKSHCLFLILKLLEGRLLLFLLQPYIYLEVSIYQTGWMKQHNSTEVKNIYIYIYALEQGRLFAGIFYWRMAMPIHQTIVRYFHSAIAESSPCISDHLIPQPKISTVWPFAGKLLISALESPCLRITLFRYKSLFFHFVMLSKLLDSSKFQFLHL